MSQREPIVHGIGIGLRQAIAEPLLGSSPHSTASALPEVQFVEIHPENYVQRGGRFRSMLERARVRWPILTHGLSLGLGAVEPADPQYVGMLKRFLAEVKAPWHSEHLCFSSADGVMLHDLMPLPFTRDAARVAAARIRELRDALECPIAVENISYYAHAGVPELDEADFLLEVLEQSDAKLLLDVNNIYVNSKNHGLDAQRFLQRMPAERVVQIHIAGHSRRADGTLIDTHGAAVHDDVYALLELALARVGRVPVLLERDQSFPSFAELQAEHARLHALYVRVTGATWP